MTTGPIARPNGELTLDSQQTDGLQWMRLQDAFDPITGVTLVGNLVWDTIGLDWVKMTQPGGGTGGGGAVTVADGADVTQGAKADAAWDGVAASPTIVAIDKAMWAKLEAVRALLAGTLTIGGAVNVSNFPATQNVDVIDRDVRLAGRVKHLDSAGAVIDPALKGQLPAALGRTTMAASLSVAIASDQANVQVQQQSSTLIVSGQGTANASFTTTVPAAGIGLFHYITAIEIIRSNPTATAVAGSAVNLAITTTNLPGSLAWHIGNALAAGGYDVPVRLMLNSPIKSSVANTATTIVCAAGGAGIQFQVNVYYYTGT